MWVSLKTWKNVPLSLCQKSLSRTVFGHAILINNTKIFSVEVFFPSHKPVKVTHQINSSNNFYFNVIFSLSSLKLNLVLSCLWETRKVLQLLFFSFFLFLLPNAVFGRTSKSYFSDCYFKRVWLGLDMLIWYYMCFRAMPFRKKYNLWRI